MTVDNVSGLVHLSRKALYDGKEVDKLFDPNEPREKDSGLNELSEQFATLTAKFPVTPPRKWSPDYYR